MLSGHARSKAMNNDQPLRDYYHFDEADLNANRSGRLTEKQVQRLKTEKKQSKIWGIGCGLGLFVIASIFPIAFIPMAIDAFTKGHVLAGIGDLVGPVIWVAVWGGLGLFLTIGSFSKSDSKIYLKSLTGPINLVGVERRSGGEHPHTYIEHELHIRGKEFEVDEEMGGYMMQGDIYTIYYIENLDGTGDEILSLEWVAKG
jgi:hypothetical protein